MNPKEEREPSSSQKEAFQFEKSSYDIEEEQIEELSPGETKDPPVSKKNHSTIKILAERDIQLKEAPPPNFSPYFTCVLHFKDKNYKERILLEVAQTREEE